MPTPGDLFGNRQILDFSGTITTGGTAQIVIPVGVVQSYLLVENLSSGNLYVELGTPRGTAVLSSGSVSSVTITNAGFGYTFPPTVQFLGGGTLGTGDAIGVGAPGFPAPGDVINPVGQPGAFPIGQQSVIPGKPAQGRAILSGGAVSSITIDNGGSSYSVAPYVLFTNDPRDPVGCAVPSTSSGILVVPNGSYVLETTYLGGMAVSIFGSTTAQRFTVKAA